ncbi:diaminopimelate decarboxylase [Thorsellia kenyensis]|uniref:Diaminopimelate decarboxylase n=1 Tax=Thorsellia kenyensis TaxID=1549888 RepID=A0ABV6CBR3_9GAMM
MHKHLQTKLFKASVLVDIYEQEKSPYWIYDFDTIREQIKKLRQFDVIRFAQKANSNIHTLKLMNAEKVCVDAVSEGEILRALKAGYSNLAKADSIVFTADVINQSTLELVIKHHIPVNTGSIDMLQQLGTLSPGHPVWLRINPGFGHGHSQKTNTGGENSKHGIWHADLLLALELLKKYNLKLLGLHMHIGSGVDYEHLKSVCDAMIAQARIVKSAGHDLLAISAGGGLSIPYKEGDATIDTDNYFKLWDTARKTIETELGHKVTLEIEPGRFLVAQSGILVSKIHATKFMGCHKFVLVDAGFNDLMRPAMYGSYHAISIIKANSQQTDWFEGNANDLIPTVVAGPLCESGDVFTQKEGGVVEQRLLPTADVNDYLVFHDAGAYGASMSSNYNSRPLIAEYAIDGGEIKQIRRKQSVQDLLGLEE